jgi:hypothetical protein
MMLRRLRGRQNARRLAQADAKALIRDHSADTYREARQREREMILPDEDCDMRPLRRSPLLTQTAIVYSERYKRERGGVSCRA